MIIPERGWADNRSVPLGPIVAAFIILALYTYSSGLRAPALIAFVKDIMIYIVVLVAVVVVPAKLGGYGAVFSAANDAFNAKGGATGLTLKDSQYLAYATLALGSALAAFMYPHTLTGVFASKSADTIRKNAILLPAYTLLLGLIALLGYIPWVASQRNPDGLPIGFVKDIDPATGAAAMGFTCAACHTSTIKVGERTLLIDGGPTLANVTRFLDTLVAAMQANQEGEKFDRLVTRMHGAAAEAVVLGRKREPEEPHLRHRRPDVRAPTAR